LSDFSHYLRELRGGRTITEVEREAKIAHGSITRAERGQRLLRYWVLYKLCEYYGVNERKAVELMDKARYERDRKKAGY
jgi:transcriptional regulator with XRE-family HTH domain